MIWPAGVELKHLVVIAANHQITSMRNLAMAGHVGCLVANLAATGALARVLSRVVAEPARRYGRWLAA